MTHVVDGFRMKILIVDDERDNLEVMARILKPGLEQSHGSYIEPMHSDYTLCVAKSGQAALKKAIEEKPDLILLDVIMPDMSGFEVLSSLKESDETRDIPVIFITGMNSVEDEEKGFFLGAVDYITKPFHNSLVRARVKTHLRIAEQMRTIEMLGLLDTLTNIPNRRGFDNQMLTEWGRAIREKRELSLLMIDIDRFKSFNDTYGHRQGDTALKAVAKVLTQTLKHQNDFAARWGGEEFTVLLPDTDIDGAMIVAEEIRANAEEAVILNIHDGSAIKLTVSIGVSVVVPDMNSLIQDFIERADKALYAAKESGRNRVCSNTTEGI